MFKKEPSSKELLRQEQHRLLVTLSKLDPESDKYKEISERLEVLNGIVKNDKEAFYRLLPIILGITGNLAGIGLIMGYEQFNVIRTKAMALLFKPKIL